jgi:thiazole synthase
MATDTTLETLPGTAADPFVFGGRTFASRLIVGTGKYATFPLMKAALEESAAEIVTVAVRRVNLTDRSKESLLDYIPKGMTLLPNTAGCYTAEDAVRAGRDAFLAGRIPRKRYATASSPTSGVIGS